MLQFKFIACTDIFCWGKCRKMDRPYKKRQFSILDCPLVYGNATTTTLMGEWMEYGDHFEGVILSASPRQGFPSRVELAHPSQPPAALACLNSGG